MDAPLQFSLSLAVTNTLNHWRRPLRDR